MTAVFANVTLEDFYDTYVCKCYIGRLNLYDTCVCQCSIGW